MNSLNTTRWPAVRKNEQDGKNYHGVPMIQWLGNSVSSGALDTVHKNECGIKMLTP